MKYILLILIFYSCSTVQLSDSERAHSIIVNTGKPKHQNYIDTRKYVAKTFKNNKRLIQMEDKDEGLIVLKAKIDCKSLQNVIGGAIKPMIDFTLSMESKDKKVRFLFENIKPWIYSNYKRVDRPDLISGPENQAKLHQCLDVFDRTFKKFIKKRDEW